MSGVESLGSAARCSKAKRPTGGIAGGVYVHLGEIVHRLHKICIEDAAGTALLQAWVHASVFVHRGRACHLDTVAAAVQIQGLAFWQPPDAQPLHWLFSQSAPMEDLRSFQFSLP